MYRWKRLATLQRIFPPKLGIKVVIWKDLDPDQSQALKDALTLQNVKTILAEIFNLTNYAEDLREAILLNLYTYTLQYARDEDFTIDKLSTYFSIVKDAHEFCTKSSFINLDETFSYFKELLLCHSVYVQLDLALVYIGEPESITNQVDHQISENRGSQATDENIDKENEPARISEKEEAKKYLRKIITEVLQEKIREIKLSVNEKLKHSEQMVKNKLGNAGYHEDKKKSLKMNKHHRK
ncbi:uncharacterized protein LOC106881705 isoform X4 [Octopus bimaculoides]|uniref:uncharacterized protein LOC106881705 isoform X4 n=1 Tax=Octopus bimaculoides TaxID=37653 RepID=UPI00071D16F6|nr:uncharacterized protein LOC106881705 isoform X4 [Octopus bimaculoides]|eukprot:XP_014787662.1 PREDICTED: uncharacterized protein LOC106881705 isoform X3 [Octopus bimaculoides]